MGLLGSLIYNFIFVIDAYNIFKLKRCVGVRGLASFSNEGFIFDCDFWKMIGNTTDWLTMIQMPQK